MQTENFPEFPVPMACLDLVIAVGSNPCDGLKLGRSQNAIRVSTCTRRNKTARRS